MSPDTVRINLESLRMTAPGIAAEEPSVAGTAERTSVVLPT